MEPETEKNHPLTVAALVVFFGALALATAGGFLFKRWLPPVASRHGAGVDRMIGYLLVATGVIFLAGHALLAGFVWRFGRRRDAVLAPIGRRAEILWAVVPALVMAGVAEVGVLVIGMPVWGEVYGEPRMAPLEVEVVAKQFEWLVRYPGKDGKLGRVRPELVHDATNPLGLDQTDPAAKDDIVLRGTLHLPAGRPVRVRLRSLDVLHSFSVPLFRTKQDAVPGMTIKVQFEPTRPGRYEIACAELCGLGHYRMRGFAIVHAPEAFEKWLAAQTGWFE